MYDWLSEAATNKALGAAAGSALAAWGMKSVRWVFDIVCGVFCGVFFGGALARYMEWPDTQDTWLATGGVLGLVGSRLVQLLLNRSLWLYLNAKLRGKAQEVSNEP